jgi:hypothetical protein
MGESDASVYQRASPSVDHQSPSNIIVPLRKPDLPFGHVPTTSLAEVTGPRVIHPAHAPLRHPWLRGVLQDGPLCLHISSALTNMGAVRVLAFVIQYLPHQVK